VAFLQGIVEAGCEPINNVIHVKDEFVWSPDLYQSHNTTKDILRISFFTCLAGDKVKVDALNAEIGKIKYSCTVGLVGSGGGRYSGGTVSLVNNGTLNPRIYTKQKGQPSKKIDVAMVIETINYSILDNINEIHLLSGDADFIPVIQEVMRRGKKVTVSSFSSGVNDEMKHIPDAYECLDNYFFKENN